LFGLDKLHQVDRTVHNFEDAPNLVASPLAPRAA
jgi:hypothetical protein